LKFFLHAFEGVPERAALGMVDLLAEGNDSLVHNPSEQVYVFGAKFQSNGLFSLCRYSRIRAVKPFDRRSGGNRHHFASAEALRRSEMAGHW